MIHKNRKFVVNTSCIIAPKQFSTSQWTFEYFPAFFFYQLTNKDSPKVCTIIQYIFHRDIQ